MSADRWAEYAGPLSDDPAELRGLPYDEPDLEHDWADLSPAQRAAATLRGLR